MLDALRYEMVRLRTLRSTYWLIAGTLGLYFVGTMLVATLTKSVGDGSQVDAAVITLGASTGFAPMLMAYILGVIGVLAMGNEYRNGMIRATLTVVPQRWAVLGAKIVTVTVVAALAASVAMLIGVLNAALFSDRSIGFDGELWGLMLGVMVYTALFALAGLAFSGLVRNQAGAIILLFAMPIVIEPIVRTILLIRAVTSGDPGWIGALAKFLPFEAGGKLYTRADLSEMMDSLSGVEPLGPTAGGVCLVVFVAALLTLMGVLFGRRDA